jgi:hypothetical protein
MPIPRLLIRKRFVDHHAARLQRVDDLWEQIALQVRKARDNIICVGR